MELGTHILLNLYDCNVNDLKYVDYINKTLTSAIKDAGLTRVGQSFHQFHPEGATGVVILSESHVCIHTWPEHSSAAIDIFTCGKKENAEKVANLLIEKFGSKNYEIKTVKR